MHLTGGSSRRWLCVLTGSFILALASVTARAVDDASLLFYLSGEKGTTADFAAPL